MNGKTGMDPTLLQYIVLRLLYRNFDQSWPHLAQRLHASFIILHFVERLELFRGHGAR
jgi:hypothetical protein